MKHLIALLLLLGLYSPTKGSEKRVTEPAVQSLVDTELQFARKTETDGIRGAFLTYLAEDAIVFRPKPIPGRKAYSEGPAPSGLLAWRPVFADVSQAGDLGYTTGPYEFKENRTDPQPSDYGHYVSIWRRKSEDTWRLVIDMGIPHDRPDTAPESWADKPAKTKRTPKRAIVIHDSGGREALREADRAFSIASSTQGSVVAYQLYGDAAIRFYRARQFPLTGMEAVREFVAQRAGSLVWEPLAAEVSQSGDLGYTYVRCNLLRMAAHPTSKAVI